VKAALTRVTQKHTNNQIHIQFYSTCVQKAKNHKAKQTIMHCSQQQYNTRQEIKCNVMAKNDESGKYISTKF